MHCPSCYYTNKSDARYCGRCRMSFKSWHLTMARFKEDLYWVLRRANAGFFAGLIAWFFIPIVSRILSQGSSEIFIFGLTGLMGGAFLGSVDGMVEESSPKTIRGALLGGLGGIVGGVIFTFVKGMSAQENILRGIFLYWAIAGAFIGLVSSWWEGQRKKWIIGVIAGFIGGGLGAYLGASVHANLVQEVTSERWLMQRFLEALLGGFIGVTLWFFIGTAERFFIFKRRLVKNQDHKKCDKCSTKNPLESWYCHACGRVLQEAAPSEKLNMPPYVTLNRFRDLFRFLSRLSAATGFIAGFVSIFVFLSWDLLGPFVFLIVVLLISLVSYTFQALFSSLAESLQIFISPRR